MRQMPRIAAVTCACRRWVIWDWRLRIAELMTSHPVECVPLARRRARRTMGSVIEIRPPGGLRPGQLGRLYRPGNHG
jgi:hypothetical protein